MKPIVFHSSLFVFIGCLLAPMQVANATPVLPDSVHFCAFDDHVEWERDHSNPASKRSANLNVGEPGTVRVILFLPGDRPFRVALVDSIKTAIKQSQRFFGEQMQAHGYGYMTFQYETDAQGEPLVHPVSGQHPESHYFEKTPGVQHALYRREIERLFDLEENVYVIFRDISKYTGSATGHRYTKKRGTANLPARAARWGVLSHELAHAFGLPHDYRDGAYVLSYGGPSQLPGSSTWDRISACAAEFLSVSPYFNSAVPIAEFSPPTIKLLSPTEYPGGARSFSIEFDVSDAEGLHQVLLYTNVAYGYKGLRECRGLEGRRNAVVEFEYDGSMGFADPERAITSLSDSLHQVEVFAVDTDGNLSKLEFDLVPDRFADALTGHTDSVNGVAFSPDRTTLASGSSDGTVRLWDVARRELLGILKGHSNSVMAVAFSPDGTLVSGSTEDIKLWDITTKNETATLIGTAPVAFSSNGTLIASGSGNRTILLWDVKTLEEIAALEGHSEQINAVAFSPDGTLLASGSGHVGSKDKTVRLWDVEKREEVASFEYSGVVSSVAFSPDGALLASASGSPDNEVRLWHVRTRREVKRLWHSGAVLSLAFSRGASILASGFTSDRGDGKVRLYDPLTLEHMGTFLPFRPRNGGVRSLAISHDGTTLAAGTEYQTIELRDVSKWKRPPFPFGLEIISGGSQQGAPGAALTSPLVVEVRDQYGNLLPEARVTFSVTAGEGKLSGRFTVQHVTTDADGRVKLALTLGPNPGPNTVVVSVGGRELGTITAKGVGTAVVELEGDYRRWHLPRAATVRLGKGALGESDRAVAVSPDGRCLAVASAIGVWLYEASTSQALALLASERAVHSVAFSLDGTLAAGLDNGQVELWEVETGQRIRTFRHGDWARVTVVFSQDGTRLVSGTGHQIIKLWDVETMRELGAWEVPRVSDNYWDVSVAFAPDGRRLASGFQDGTVRLWDVATRKEVATLGKHTDRVTSVSFSPDGSLLASAGAWSDPTVRLWNTETRTEIATLTGHTGAISSVVFSWPDGATLASGSWDRTVRLWDLAKFEEVATLEEHGDGVVTVVYSPDGTKLASGAIDGTVLLRDQETGNAAGLSGHGILSSMALSSDGVALAMGYQDGTIRLWDAAREARIATLDGHTSGVSSVAFSSDGATLASGSWDRTVRLWDVKTQEPAGTLEGHSGGVTSVTFSPDGATLASAGGWRDATVRLWDLASREPIGTLEGHTQEVRSVSFSPDGALLASGGGYEDKTVRIWNVATREPIGILEGHTGSVNAVAFSNDDALLASGSGDGVRLWDVGTQKWRTSLNNRRSVHSLAFSADGAMLVSGSWYTAILWDVETREQIATLEGHTGLVHSVAFSDNGDVLATGASDGTMLLWNIADYLAPSIPNPDFDGDGTVGFPDFLLFATAFGRGQGDAEYDARFDLDGNGAIGFSDFLIFAGAFGTSTA